MAKTKFETFEEIKGYVADNAELVAFCEHEQELLAKKNAKRSAANSKKKAETDARMEKVYNALAEMDKPVTVTELISLTSDEEVAGYSKQRVSAMLRRLGERVVKTYEKKVSYFSIA